VQDNSKKNIILIYPKFSQPLRVNIPIGLLHLGTYLKDRGFGVRLIDCTIEEDWQQLIADESKDALCVGISAMTVQVPHALHICKFIKEKLNYEIPIIFGGAHPTLYPEQTVSDPYVDYVVIGEGEITAEHLFGAIQKKEMETIPAMSGIAYRDQNGRARSRPSDKNFNYQDMPPFDYNLLNPKVFSLYEETGTYFPLLTSRGCPFRCAFCINVVTKNIRWRCFSAARTVNEIERILKMGFDKIWFWDENFFTSKQRLQEILSLLEQKNLSFSAWAEGRANYVRNDYLDLNLLKRLRAAGFNRMGFGFESGSQKVLDYLQKDITTEQILNAARQCYAAGIRISATFMTGIPKETTQDVRKTLTLIGKLLEICSSCGISGPILYRPYPGSKLYNHCLEAGWDEPQSLKEWVGKVEHDFKKIPNPYRLPWIKDPAFVNFVHFYTYTVPASFKSLYLMFKEYCQMTLANKHFFYIGLCGLFLISSLGKMRYRLGFFRLLIEKKIFSKYHPNLDY